jgi:hypothetical protein
MWPLRVPSLARFEWLFSSQTENSTDTRSAGTRPLHPASDAPVLLMSTFRASVRNDYAAGGAVGGPHLRSFVVLPPTRSYPKTGVMSGVATTHPELLRRAGHRAPMKRFGATLEGQI